MIAKFGFFALYLFGDRKATGAFASAKLLPASLEEHDFRRRLGIKIASGAAIIPQAVCYIFKTMKQGCFAEKLRG
jgi:hypothetical protein